CADWLSPAPVVARENRPTGAAGRSRAALAGGSPCYRGADGDHSPPTRGTTHRPGTGGLCPTFPVGHTQHGANWTAATHGTVTVILNVLRARKNPLTPPLPVLTTV